MRIFSIIGLYFVGGERNLRYYKIFAPIYILNKTEIRLLTNHTKGFQANWVRSTVTCQSHYTM